MLQTVSWLLPELPLFLATAVATHLVMSFAQTLMHYKLGHCPIGGRVWTADGHRGEVSYVVPRSEDIDLK